VNTIPYVAAMAVPIAKLQTRTREPVRMVYRSPRSRPLADAIDRVFGKLEAALEKANAKQTFCAENPSYCALPA